MHKRWQRGLAAVVCCAIGLVGTGAAPAPAASPAAGTVSAGNPTLTWTGTASVPQPAGCVGDGLDACDRFTLTVEPLAVASQALDITVATAQGDVDDFDLVVFGPDGSQVANSGHNGTPPEKVRIPAPKAGAYTVEVSPYLVRPGTTYTGTAALSETAPTSAGATQTWYFTSANGGYARDLAADPSATAESRAPDGSALVGTRPAGTTSYQVTPRNSVVPAPGSPGYPTFSLPAAASITSLCADVWVSLDPLLSSEATLFPYLSAPAPGVAQRLTSIAGPSGAAPHEVRSLITPTALAETGEGWSFLLSTYVDAATTFHYGSADRPSSLTVNPAPGTCPAVGGPTGGADPVDATASAVPAPQYTTYEAPAGLADSSGEPSIAWVGPRLDKVMFQGGFDTNAVSWDDSSPDPVATWTHRNTPLNTLVSLDPIMAADPVTGRMIVSQLEGVCSGAAYSDDAGASFTPSTGCGQPHGADHQTIGFGPVRPGSPEAGIARQGRMAYYCSQSNVTAFCASSVDGAQSFGPSSPVFPITSGCGAFHGHVKVGPDGYVYLPNERCNGQAVAVSPDNGRTWSNAMIPNFSAVADLTHPSVTVSNADAANPGGVIYYANADAQGRPLVAKSTDHGQTWSQPVNVAPNLGLKAVEFPVVLAGDPNRVAFAFLGTSSPGNYSAPGFGDRADGTNSVEWHLYVAHSYDGGTSWSVTDATPTDPVQRGCLWRLGTTQPNSPQEACRNLLDFNGITMDGKGRVLIGYADGCTGACVASNKVSDNARTKRGAIARETRGTGLLAAFDGQLDPTGTAAVCAITDPLGDAVFIGLQPGVNQPALDIIGANAVRNDDGSVTFTFKGDKIGDPPPPQMTGYYYRWTFTNAGTTYYVEARKDSAPTAGETFRFVKAGTAVTPAPTGVFDVAAREARVTVPAASFATPPTPASTIGSNAVETRGIEGVVASLYDSAGAGCEMPLVAAAAPVVPELPFTPALPLAAVVLVGGGVAVLRRRRPSV